MGKAKIGIKIMLEKFMQCLKYLTESFQGMFVANVNFFFQFFSYFSVKLNLKSFVLFYYYFRMFYNLCFANIRDFLKIILRT